MAYVGPLIDSNDMLVLNPSQYEPILKAFQYGGLGGSFGEKTSSSGIGLKFKTESGFGAGLSGSSANAFSTEGMFTDEDISLFNLMFGYTEPSDLFHLSGTFSMHHGDFDGWEYFGRNDSSAVIDNSVAYRFWIDLKKIYDSRYMPTLTLGLDTASVYSGSQIDNGLFAGLQWVDVFIDKDRIGTAIGKPLSAASVDPADASSWEAFYSLPVTDNITITPAILGGSASNSSQDEDFFGGLVKTTFKF